LFSAEALKGMVFQVNGVTFQPGLVISAVINFLIIALLFFVMVKFLLKKEKVTKDVLN
jgi:large-conductance mechanosensitive channel